MDNDRVIAEAARVALESLYGMIAKTARPLANAWEPVPDKAMPDYYVRMFLVDVRHFAMFYARVANRARMAADAVAFGDRYARGVIRLDEGSEV